MKNKLLFIILFVIFSNLIIFSIVNFIYATDDVKLKSKSILRIGRIPYLDPRKVIKNYEPLMEYLKEELNINDVRLVLAPDYDSLTKFLKDDLIDIAWHSTISYPKAYKEAHAHAILTPLWSGKKKYSGVIVTRSDSNINSISDLKGKSFAFNIKSSTSGYFLPMILLIENGIDPNKDFIKVEYIKKHDNILYNVLYKKFDAGAVYNQALNLLSDNEQKQLKVIAKTIEIFNEPIMVKCNISDDLVIKIKNAFLKLNNNDDIKYKKILQSIGNLEGFALVSDEDYKEVVDLINKYGYLIENENINLKTSDTTSCEIKK